MRAFMALVDDLDTVFDPAIHCDPAGDGFLFRRMETEAQITVLEIEREQRGLAILAVQANRNVLLSWTPTDDPSDAVLFARGYIAPEFQGIFDLTQTIRVICAPRDVEAKKLEFAKASLTSRPETDNRFSDFDPEDASSYLLGRSVNFHVDPVTHEISVTDELKGNSVHYLSDLIFGEEDGAAPVSSMGDAGYPPKTLRYRLSVAWTQEAGGQINIASQLPFDNSGDISTLDPSFGDNFASSFSIESADGWSMASEVTYKFTTSQSAFYNIKGALYEATYDRSRDLIRVKDQTSDEFFDVEALKFHEDQEVKTQHTVEASFQVYNFKFTKFVVGWNYVQPREESILFSMDIPLQSTLATSDTAETIELSVSDPFSIPSVPDYEEETEYRIDDVVLYNGQYYRAKSSHFSESFSQQAGTETVTIAQHGVASYTTTVPTTFWEIYKPDWLPDRGLTDTVLTNPARSNGNYPALTDLSHHVACRMRKAARRYLRLLNVTVACRWEDAATVTTKDDAVIRAPDGRAMRGKVIAVEHVWGGEDGQEPHAKIMLGVALGDGAGSLYSYENPYGEEDYAIDWFDESDGIWDDVNLMVNPAGEDLQPISRPVSVDLLRQGAAAYAVLTSGVVRNTAGDQLRIIPDLDDPTEAPQILPTHATGMKLRSLVSKRTLSREFEVHCDLKESPSGYLIHV